MKESTATWNSIQSTLKTLEEILENTNADRCCLMSANRPKRMTDPIYTSVLYEAYSWPLDSLQERWQKVRADFRYMSILNRIHSYGYDQRFVDQMSNSVLQATCDRDGVNHVLFFRESITKERMTYIQVETASHSKFFYPKDWDYLRSQGFEF